MFPKEIVLLNFKPFNDIWCMNCNEQMVVTILQYYNIDLSIYFLNQIHYYNFIKNDNLAIGAGTIKKYTTNKLLNNCGISQDENCNYDDNHLEIKYCLNNGYPIIAFIDCYYEPIRNDTYFKKHYSHAITIFGYNDVDCKYNIIEHEYYNSKKYLQTTISYEDFNLCQIGYNRLNNFDDNTHSFTGYKKNTYIKINDECIKEQYYKFLKENKEVSINSLMNLLKFITEFEKLEYNLLLNSGYIVTHLCGLINSKIFDLYRNDKYLYLNIESINNQQKVLNYWNIIRGLIEKMNIKQQYDVKSHKKCIELLKNIFEIENIVHNYFD